MRFRFVHAADLHLDTPFAGLAGSDSLLAERLRDASLTALDRIVAEALDVGAAFVVFAGDLYDGVQRGIRAQLRFRAALTRLSDAGIPSFIAHGNHDPEGGSWSAIPTWPPLVTVFPAGTPISVPVVRDGAHLATVHGVSYGQRAERDNLALRFPTPARGGGLHVGVLHCNVDGATGHEPYSPCTLGELTARGMGYWALGHVHRQRVLAEGPAWVVYPGNTQGRSFGAGEQGAKGALVVDVEDGAVVGVRPFTTDSVRFVELEANVARFTELGELVDALVGGARAAHDAHGDVELLVRARLSGRGELHQVLRDGAKRAELLQSLRDEAPPGLNWLALVGETRPALDLEAVYAAGDLRAEIIALWRRWQGAGRDGDGGLPAGLREELGKVGGEPPAELLAELLEEAAYEVLDRLTTDTEVA